MREVTVKTYDEPAIERLFHGLEYTVVGEYHWCMMWRISVNIDCSDRRWDCILLQLDQYSVVLEEDIQRWTEAHAIRVKG